MPISCLLGHMTVLVPASRADFILLPIGLTFAEPAASSKIVVSFLTRITAWAPFMSMTADGVVRVKRATGPKSGSMVIENSPFCCFKTMRMLFFG